MHVGAVVMMDALGFKGIWREEGRAEGVLAKLAGMAESAPHDLQQFMGGAAVDQVEADPVNLFSALRVLMLSDTVAIGFGVKLEHVEGPPQDGWTQEQGRFAHAFAMHFAAKFASEFMQRALRDGEPPIAYRGCMTFGEFEMRDRFIIGPAVDEAASLMEIAQGAFVWLSPTGLATYNAGAGMDAPFLVPYDVPIKGGDTYKTLCISPTGDAAPMSAELTHLETRLASSFRIRPGVPLDVAIKRDRTMQFFEACKARLADTDGTETVTLLTRAT